MIPAALAAVAPSPVLSPFPPLSQQDGKGIPLSLTQEAVLSILESVFLNFPGFPDWTQMIHQLKYYYYFYEEDKLESL